MQSILLFAFPMSKAITFKSNTTVRIVGMLTGVLITLLALTWLATHKYKNVASQSESVALILTAAICSLVIPLFLISEPVLNAANKFYKVNWIVSSLAITLFLFVLFLCLRTWIYLE